MTLSAKWKNRATVGQNLATDSIRIIRTIRTIPPQANSANTANYANANPTPAFGTGSGPSCLTWPEPEPFPLVAYSVPWKYACLFAIASVYRAGLTKDAGGGLILTCPATMPQEAAQAAQDALAELQDYIKERSA